MVGFVKNQYLRGSNLEDLEDCNLEISNWLLNLVEQVHETSESLFLIACNRNFPSGIEPLYKEKKYYRQNSRLSG